MFITRYDGSIPVNRLTDSAKTPYALGGYFLHKRKIGKSDFVYDAYAHESQSWLQGDFDKRVRGHFKYRYRINDRMQFGVNTTGLFQHTSQFLFWSNDSTGAYQPLQGTTTLVVLKEVYTTVDPLSHIFYKRRSKTACTSGIIIPIRYPPAFGNPLQICIAETISIRNNFLLGC